MSSTIQTNLKNQTILLTGATGFLGKVILEKLLRSCPEIKKIYLIIRPKKNKTPDERLYELFQLPLYQRLHDENPKFMEKVGVIAGDCQLVDFGIDLGMRELLTNQITYIINSAAIVRFGQPLREIAIANVSALKSLINFAINIKNLRGFLQVSTIFSHPYRTEINENFYDINLKPEKFLELIDILDEKKLEKIETTLLDQWPNTYAYTKAMGEELLRQYLDKLPIAIVRPAIVVSTADEPIPGWVDNFYGPMGIVAGASLGVIHSVNARLDNPTNIIPVDYTANLVIAATASLPTEKSKIYNYTTWNKQLTWGEFVRLVEKHAWNYPINRLIWYYSFKIRENTGWHKFIVFLTHTCVAYIVDIIFVFIGRPPIAVKSYERIHRQLDMTTYFTLRSWQFGMENTKNLWMKMTDFDRHLFKFSMDQFDFDKFALNSIIGGRRYLFKENDNTIDLGKKKMFKLAIAHYTLMFIFYYIIYRICLSIIYLLF